MHLLNNVKSLQSNIPLKNWHGVAVKAAVCALGDNIQWPVSIYIFQGTEYC